MAANDPRSLNRRSARSAETTAANQQPLTATAAAAACLVCVSENLLRGTPAWVGEWCRSHQDRDWADLVPAAGVVLDRLLEEGSGWAAVRSALDSIAAADRIREARDQILPS